MYGDSEGFEALLRDYQSVGGTVEELIAEFERAPTSVTRLAEKYGLDRADLEQLVEANELVDELLEADASRKEGDSLDRVIELGLEAGLTGDEIKEMYHEVRREVEAELSAKVPMKPKRRAASRSVGGGKKRLPERIRPHLEQWLEAGHSAKEFFEVNADVLGDPTQYDLTEFVETDREWMQRVTDA